MDRSSLFDTFCGVAEVILEGNNELKEVEAELRNKEAESQLVMNDVQETIETNRQLSQDLLEHMQFDNLNLLDNAGNGDGTVEEELQQELEDLEKQVEHEQQQQQKAK